MQTCKMFVLKGLCKYIYPSKKKAAYSEIRFWIKSSETVAATIPHNFSSLKGLGLPQVKYLQIILPCSDTRSLFIGCYLIFMLQCKTNVVQPQQKAFTPKVIYYERYLVA